MTTMNIPEFHEMKKNKRKNIPSLTRRHILRTNNRTCAYCDQKATSVDHIIPVYQNGEHDYSNLTAACIVCNQVKSNLSKEQYEDMYANHDVSLLSPSKIGELYYIFEELIESGNPMTENHWGLYKSIKNSYPYEVHKIPMKKYYFDYMSEMLKIIQDKTDYGTLSDTINNLLDGDRGSCDITSVGVIYQKYKTGNKTLEMVLPNMITIAYFMDRSNPWKASVRINSMREKNIRVDDDKIEEIFDRIIDMQNDGDKTPVKRRFENETVVIKVRKDEK